MSTKPRRTKVGMINMQRPEMGVKKKWKPYRFQVTSTYLLYFKSENTHRADGQILLNNVTKLETDMARGASYPLQIHFRGKAEHGAGSPWTLDLTSNEERIDWMDAIKPGSSDILQRFSKTGSLHRALPPDSPDSISYNPYSLADPDPSVNNGTSSLPFSSVGTNVAQPQNYMKPVSSGGWDIEDQNHKPVVSKPVGTKLVGNTSVGSTSVVSKPVGTQSEFSERTQHGVQHKVSATFDGTSNRGKQDPRNGKPRQASLRSTIGHAEREHDHQLTRSSTERIATKSPEHLYELDASQSLNQSKPPLPDRIQPKPPLPNSPVPKVMPRDKRLRHTSGSLSDSQPPQSPPFSNECLLSPDVCLLPQDGPKFHFSNSANKEPQFDIPSQDVPSQPPVPKQRTKPRTNGSPQADLGASSTSKPLIIPRKKVLRPVAPPLKQPNYLDLIDSEEDGLLAADDGLPPELSEEMLKSFTPDQVGKLMGMLQQVQHGGKQQPEVPASPHIHSADSEGSSNTADHNQMRKNFERVVSQTPQLHTDKILVIDEDDEEGYEVRPDWAKAVGLHKTKAGLSQAEPDTLSDLQKEALYIDRSRLDEFEAIGEGQFGEVFRAMMQGGPEPLRVAVKTAKKSTSAKEKEEFRKEMEIMSQMVHPNIVRLYGIVKDGVPAPWIVLEYLHNGDIKNFLMKNERPIAKLVKYMLDVSMGMHYLSERGLVHRDLAARNVLVGENETCKVSDFGLLRELPKDDSIYHMQTNVPCPVRWMPPESISDREFSPASDVWSFGILQWEMFYPNTTPYENLGNLEVAMKVMKGHRLEVPPSCPPVICRIMKACWHHVPDKRPSFLLISTLLTTKVTFSSEVY